MPGVRHSFKYQYSMSEFGFFRNVASMSVFLRFSKDSWILSVFNRFGLIVWIYAILKIFLDECLWICIHSVMTVTRNVLTEFFPDYNKIVEGIENLAAGEEWGRGGGQENQCSNQENCNLSPGCHHTHARL